MEVKARGKLLLFGEHSAVYGSPALGLTLDRTLTLVMTPRKSTLPVVEDSNPRFVESTRAFICSQEEEPFNLLNNYDFKITSEIPSESGFGSSGALCGALALALGKITGEKKVWSLAHKLEHHFHGTPSGIDTALALGKGLQAFRGRPAGLPRPEPLEGFPFSLVYGALPREKDTRELIAMVRRKRQEEQGRTQLERLGSLAERGIQLLKGRGSPEGLGRLASRAQEALRSLDLSHPLLEEILAREKDWGGLGGKLSGAGGGGAFFLVFPDPSSALEGQKALKGFLASRLYSCPVEIFHYQHH